MKVGLPSSDDRVIWNIWLSMLSLPSLTAADEVGIFPALAEAPAGIPELAERLSLSERGVNTLLPMLASLGLLVQHAGVYHLADAARIYLLPDSPFYWGGILGHASKALHQHHSLVQILRKREGRGSGQWSGEQPPIDAWESGELGLERARQIAAFMHSHSMAAAVGLACNDRFDEVGRLLDVGGGSGCFSIALAQAHAGLCCTVMELPAMCTVAAEYIAAAGAQDRVDTRAVDMFRQSWPSGYDAIFFSNIFHDWSDDVCTDLARKAHGALDPGGRILLHEILVDDGRTGPYPATAFSMLMLLGTRGRQFSFPELESMLRGAGFDPVNVRPSYGYYSLVEGRKA